MKTLFTYLFAAGLLAVCLLGFLSMPVDAERQPKAIMPEITLDELEAAENELIEAALRAQLTAYQALLPPRYHCTHLYALKLSADGTYQLREVPADRALLDACLFMNNATERKKRT